MRWQGLTSGFNKRLLLGYLEHAVPSKHVEKNKLKTQTLTLQTQTLRSYTHTHTHAIVSLHRGLISRFAATRLDVDLSMWRHLAELSNKGSMLRADGRKMRAPPAMSPH